MKYSSAIKAYNSLKNIDGWFSHNALLLFSLIDSVQKENDITGNVFEIGVHHGRSAVFLGQILIGGETLSICDLFGSEQSQNVSNSGKGNRSIFESNFKSLSPGKSFSVFEKLSSDLSPSEIGNGYRFFHIDGGHNVDEALFDMELAAQVMVDGGAIIMDDPMTFVWPGVAEAIFRFLDKYSDYCAVVAGFNKMVLVKKEFASLYTSKLDDDSYRAKHRLVHPVYLKKLPFMGCDIRIFYTPTFVNPNSFRTKIQRFLLERKLPEW